jgi:mannosyltransferase OCH1-like enzyme
MVHQVWVQGEPVGEPSRLMAAVEKLCWEKCWWYRLWHLEADRMVFHGIDDFGEPCSGDVVLSAREAEVARTAGNVCVSNVSDLMRFLILRHVGGLYIDADVEIHALPEGLRDVWLYGSNSAADCLDTSVLAAPSGHPFIAAVCERLASPEGMLGTRKAPAASSLWFVLRSRREGDWGYVRVWPASAWATPDSIYGHHLARRRVWGSDRCL